MNVLTATIALALTASAATADTVNFARSTFDANDWTFEGRTAELAGSEGGAALVNEHTHGTYGSSVRLRFYSNVGTRLFGMAFLDDATWNPTTDGAIASINAGMVSWHEENGFGALNVQPAFYIEQGGNYYAYRFGLESIADPDVGHADFASGLTASDFVQTPVDNGNDWDYDSHPDFINGGAIRFGFGMDWVFTDNGPALNRNFFYGVDNFSLSIDYRATPAPGALSVLGMTCIAARRRRS